ncbi:maleylpyruvate isomerase N-terminal domain-containing protein [Amycolatopsis sp., V23-08]|uniref:Maleylpyruvate isomerase N-terminal domain-containing protein n=1 Tax=Amycolatopsis heterodermiae TaxID=3110235 RepID=A0ABU5R9L2_9PSEU|nr:maleylpyruvate isomerase N-terminal domain-containing protein [Amycolatopsis sp., V23-08]MEA5362489.1 maleylpyruvate isomerase N-terminal domain-containing protein [Amycolatopsis sp., V23-08]
MHNTVEFPEVLRLIEDRSAAFRAAIASAADLGLRVPACPDWTLRELAQHLGDGRRRQAAIVAAGPGAEPPAKTDPKGAPSAPRDPEALDAWLTESTELMLDALRAAGPDRGCWTWWARSQAPQTSGAVARHQLQEIAVHTYDAQLTQRAAQPLPAGVAVEGVDEFLTTVSATTVPWPFTPATIDLHATEGRSWRLTLDTDGVRCDDLAADAEPGDAAMRGPASELVLCFYDRVSLDGLEITGDIEPVERLAAWDPDA